MAQPANLVDPKSGLSYFQAVTALALGTGLAMAVGSLDRDAVCDRRFAVAVRYEEHSRHADRESHNGTSAKSAMNPRVMR